MSYARKLMKLKVMVLNKTKDKYRPFRIEIFKGYIKIEEAI